MTPDEVYEPGYRFYCDAEKIVINNKLLRTGNGIPTCHEILDIEPDLITYETAKPLSEFAPEKWTPKSLTEIVNKRFEIIFLSQA